MTTDSDDALAEKYGAYAGFRTAAAPVRAEYHGEDPAREVDRLLDLYVYPGSRVLDVGCGAGQTLCRLAPTVEEAWGIDLDPDLLEAARRRVAEQALPNVRLVEGNITVPEDVAQLPADSFDLAFSRRGPNLNASLLRTLRDGAMVVQELVSGMDCYQLREILGRRPYAPSPFGGGEGLPGHYTELGLVPVSSKEYFYDELFHDADHLEVYLRQVPALLSDWRFSPRPYEPLRDRAALDLYVRYNTTAGGVRLRRRRHVFVLHWTHMAPYPVDGEDAQPRSARATPGGAARVPRATPGGGLQLLAANLSGTSGSWQWVPLRAILLYDGGIRSDG